MAKVNVRRRAADEIDFDGAAETPSQQVIAQVAAEERVKTAEGRVLTVRKVSPMFRMKLFAAIGPELSKNQQYLGIALLAAAVSSIDGEVVPFPATRLQVEALVDRLGDAGLEAAGEGVLKLMGLSVDAAGNVVNEAGEALATAKN